MSSETLEEQVERFQDMVGSTERLGVSEFARSRSWRDRLPVVGCLEVVDRSGVVGYLLSPGYATSLIDKMTDLEERAERAQIAAMFRAREHRGAIKTGGDLKSAALAYFDDKAEALTKAIHGG